MTEPLVARVRVPASSANVGAGFDCIGFAVDRWLTVSVTVSAETGGVAPDVTIERGGTLASLAVPVAHDVVVAGFVAACKARGRAVPRRLDFEMRSEIPVSRGLGASSAALVAGAMLADAMLKLGFEKHELAELCTELEGHPDNVAPAVLGGAVLGVRDEVRAGRWIFSKLAVEPSLAFAFVIPEVMVETDTARAILPKEMAHGVAVKAAAKAAALAHGLVTGDPALLRAALDDVLHVPYRRHLVPGYEEVVAAARGAGAYGATLSGSGSTLVGVSDQRSAEGIAAAMQHAFVERGIQAEAFVQRSMLTVGAEPIP